MIIRNYILCMCAYSTYKLCVRVVLINALQYTYIMTHIYYNVSDFTIRMLYLIIKNQHILLSILHYRSFSDI